ncbi:MAG: hypothetical protein CDV28_1494 [Candidatus Electronema aureum]|uniref:Uncharacterized protein n=1 Tax=Candidatus Electronema aureum TaxID=2005002 RepID=A0A521FYS5_9BACT|nr:MAG: hypothetical protein CDV28_1494 [Candidatus Electronema aureum]
MIMPQQIGIVGVPPLEIIRQLNAEQAAIIDLDEPQLVLPIDQSDQYLPRVYCAILRTVLLNALNLRLERIYVDVGPGKCDCALHVAAVLKDILSIPVIATRNTDTQSFGFPVCQSSLPLIEKMRRITKGVQSCQPWPQLPACPPTAGFWGVPPRDFSILAPFPDSTHIYGWTRCMENKTPADLELESYCNPAVPTVFFAQSFCAKTALAKHLAARHPKALWVDCDVSAGSSARAKIEAFLELSGVLGDGCAAG